MGLNQLLSLSLLLIVASLPAQSNYWQQAVKYDMEIDFDVKDHRFTGEQIIVYTNNSPDTLQSVFYHLYLNAFQPGSMMDVRSRNIRDADPRVGDRIQHLQPNEIGFQEVDLLTQDGIATNYQIEGTILEVNLPRPILPGATTELRMIFRSQVPIQIRRNGRDSKEGIAYSMAQWYPRLCEYDYQGWHAHPYVGREFHGVWGDFDVKITIDSKYIIGASGYLQNAEEIGGGYADISPLQQSAGAKKTYHFFAPNVHDFVWAADPDYLHTNYERDNGMVMQFFYQPGEKTTENWEKLPAIMDEAFNFINKNYGPYPYDKYAFIQGGDGGMEYPMATLITGERPLTSLVGVSVHELLHSWYQMVLATNEALYPWMDEGFTSYASAAVMNHLRSKGLIPGDSVEDPHLRDLTGLLGFMKSGLAEPMSTHADHYVTNSAYGVNAYVKGSVFLHQIRYIIGDEAFKSGMLRFYHTWKFKHPNANDFIRVMEKESGLELDWFKEYFVNTTHLADYGIEAVNEGERRTTEVVLNKVGVLPMPVDLVVTTTKGETLYYTIPLRVMRGAKTQDGDRTFETAPDWPWTHPNYTLTIDIPFKRIASIDLDPSGRMLDADRSNNTKLVNQGK